MTISKTLSIAATVMTVAAGISVSNLALAKAKPQKTDESATIEVLTTYPHGNFLENLEVQQDGRLLFTNYPTKSIEVMEQSGQTKTFSTLSAYPLSLISIDGGYLVAASGKSLLLGENVVGSQQFILLDKNGKQTGQFDAPQVMYLNGMVRLGNNVILAVDSLSGNIWQVNPKTQEISSWIQDESLSPLADQKMFIPGANGVKLRSDGLIVSNTSKGTLSLIRIGNDGKPQGKPELLAKVGMIDDFWVREDGSILFTTHGETVKSLSISGEITTIVADGAGGATAIAPYPLNQDSRFVMINDGNIYFGKKDLVEVLLVTIK
ncbi:hypothetical protein FX988_00711 [Paraglaciecola mesophila]|uniref:SMP-30/Gluconolactonase/LRE-like region domain-containing protein n=1 Tax=Paraglaciecola mesophila TaxID=197222 RepID=A0A857JHT9_9ALTE|nr:hypothetical protein [Paraglaciecola mesophila]QHJ10497.1 hypothetical protein FX988_00711 [Paraglaciecola mesophila]